MESGRLLYGANQVQQALALIQQIRSNNIASIAIQQQANFYEVMIKIADPSPSIVATTSDINKLVAVMTSNTDYSAAACRTLAVLAPALAGNCSNLAATNGNRIGKTTEVAELQGTVLNEALFANAPNPFNESTLVKYILPADAKKATLKVFDIKGALVKQLNLGLDMDEISVYADDMISGIYTYTIEVNDQPSANKGKMVVIK